MDLIELNNGHIFFADFNICRKQDTHRLNGMYIWESTNWECPHFKKMVQDNKPIILTSQQLNVENGLSNGVYLNGEEVGRYPISSGIEVWLEFWIKMRERYPYKYIFIQDGKGKFDMSIIFNFLSLQDYKKSSCVVNHFKI